MAILGRDVGGVAGRAELQRKMAFLVVAPDREGRHTFSKPLEPDHHPNVFLCQSVGLQRCSRVLALKKCYIHLVVCRKLLK